MSRKIIRFEGESPSEIEEGQKARLESLKEKQARFKTLKKPFVIKKAMARHLGDGLAEACCEPVALKKQIQLPEGCFWFYLYNDGDGWISPASDGSDGIIRLSELGMTNDSQATLSRLSEFYEAASKRHEWAVLDASGKLVKEGKGSKEDFSEAVKEIEDGQEITQAPTAKDEQFSRLCFRLKRILAQDFPDEVWTALEDAFRAGMECSELNLESVVLSDLKNDEFNENKTGGTRGKNLNSQKWKEEAKALFEASPSIKPRELKAALLASGTFTEVFKLEGSEEELSMNQVIERKVKDGSLTPCPDRGLGERYRSKKAGGFKPKTEIIEEIKKDKTITKWMKRSEETQAVKTNTAIDKLNVFLKDLKK